MTLSVWIKDGYTVEVLKRRLDDAAAAVGTDIDLRVLDEVGAHDTFVEAARAGTPPDVVTVSFWYLPEYAANGWLRPIAEVDPAVDLEAYHPTALAAMHAGGELLAVPHTLIGGMLSARGDLLDAAGLALPEDPAALCSAAATLATPGRAGLVARARPDFPSYGTFSGWAWSKGVALLEDEPGTVAAAIEDLVATLRTHGAPDAAAMDYIAAGDALRTGQAALAFDTSGWGNVLEDPSQSDVVGRMRYGVPRGPAAALQFPYSEGLAVTAASTRADLAARLLAWRHDPATLTREALEQGRVDFPRRDLRAWPDIAEAAEARGLEGYLTALAAAWDAIELASFPLRPDFVDVGRKVMGPISAAVAGRVDDLAAALSGMPR